MKVVSSGQAMDPLCLCYCCGKLTTTEVTERRGEPRETSLGLTHILLVFPALKPEFTPLNVDPHRWLSRKVIATRTAETYMAGLMRATDTYMAGLMRATDTYMAGLMRATDTYMAGLMRATDTYMAGLVRATETYMAGLVRAAETYMAG